jgi:hypothetical protein
MKFPVLVDAQEPLPALIPEEQDLITFPDPV